MHIRTRNDLIEFLEINVPRKAIVRAMQEGQVEVYGAFEQIPPSPDPGWIVGVTSKFNKTWYIVIQVNFHTLGLFKIWIIDYVPWKFWVGEFANNKLYRGDNPKQYKELRDVARSNRL